MTMWELQRVMGAIEDIDRGMMVSHTVFHGTTSVGQVQQVQRLENTLYFTCFISVDVDVCKSYWKPEISLLGVRTYIQLTIVDYGRHRMHPRFQMDVG